MAKLSVNLNKIALLRNSRDSVAPDLNSFGLAAIAAGAPSLTVHPREDERHVRMTDVPRLAQIEPVVAGRVELNVEGDLRESLVALVCDLAPTQFTVVPVMPREVTSTRGWREDDDHEALKVAMARMRDAGVGRISVFCDPDACSVDLAIAAGADAVELYTGAYAHAFDRGGGEAELAAIAAAAARVRAAGLRLHGGHGLTLENMPPMLAIAPMDEVSIGHHLTIEALRRGWHAAVGAFIACANGQTNDATAWH
ncbi:pyridoxine 5'-phosphate synthase [Brevundimonas nasdae]|uniref:pyridoxine 5'-phosphate synthase n=1 Tax=Brevundimonas nasdae TaxID=172043 RepID=UPI003F692210